MSHYESLKDYFQEEHIELIMNAVKEHISYELKVDCQVNAPCVKSIECIKIDTLHNVEYELGIAADIVEDDKIVSSSFLLTIRGNLEKNFKDINVIYVRDIDEDDFPKDNLLNQFILPDWSESEMEGLGSGLYEFYKSHGLYRKYKLNIHMLVDRGKLYFAPLPENCFGRVILSKLDVEVIQKGYITSITTRTISASPGTILLNYKHYGVNMDGGLRITVAHELIHSAFHRAFLKILQLLGEEKIDLNSSTGNVTSYENMTDIQKALCIAEWQANELSMRFAMPETTIKSLLDDMAFTPYLYDNKGDWIQVLINTLAKEYGVSPLIAKSRLRQLGYDYVDGTCLGSDDHRKKPFYFPLGTLKGNESFVINRSNFERVTRENEYFAKLINSGRYIFLGHVVCMFSSKYVIAISNSDNYEVEFELGDYARLKVDSIEQVQRVMGELDYFVVKLAEQNPDAVKQRIKAAVTTAKEFVSTLPRRSQSSSAVMLLSTAIMMKEVGVLTDAAVQRVQDWLRTEAKSRTSMSRCVCKTVGTTLSNAICSGRLPIAKQYGPPFWTADSAFVAVDDSLNVNKDILEDELLSDVLVGRDTALTYLTDENVLFSEKKR